jgi:glycosyltransferase involved in cell wall biosynthesis
MRVAAGNPMIDGSHMVCVVIPTCQRAPFLREALESVRRQTARKAIAQVVVSENSTNDESRAVCGEFPDLPITYLQQKPPMPALFHVQAIWEAVRSPVIAFLHDDDWWAPDHLASALGILEKEPKCAAVFSSHFVTQGPQFPFQVSHKLWRVWASQELGLSGAEIILDEVGVMLNCLFEATFHYSTLVGRRKPVIEAQVRVVSTGNPFDNDRTFPIFLSEHGAIGYVVRPDVFVRSHPEQDGRQDKYEGRLWVLLRDTTRWLLKAEPAKVAAAVARFNALRQNMAPGDVVTLSNMTGEPQRTALIQECGLNLIPSVVGSRVRSLIRQVCPPFALAGARRSLQYLRLR